MRLYIKLTENTEIIPFNYQSLLTGTIHKWIGVNNEYHGRLGLYSFSFLQNTKSQGSKGINTIRDSYFFFSAHDESIVKKVLKGITRDSSMFSGMRVKEVQLMKKPDFNVEERFNVASPVFIKKNIEGGKVEHLLFDHVESSMFLTESLISKMNKAGVISEGVQVKFDDSYLRPQTKLLRYNQVVNKASLCPVIIKGTPEQIAFAWTVGIGHSTGIGFGSLK